MCVEHDIVTNSRPLTPPPLAYRQNIKPFCSSAVSLYRMFPPPGTSYRSSASSVPPHAYPASPRGRSSHSSSLQRKKRGNEERATHMASKQGTAGRIGGVGGTSTLDIYPVPHWASPPGVIWTRTSYAQIHADDGNIPETSTLCGNKQIRQHKRRRLITRS